MHMDMDRFGRLDAIQVGLVASLFMELGRDPDRAMLPVLEEYLDRYRPQVRNFLEGDTADVRVFGDRERAYTRRRLSRKRRETIYVHATGSPDLRHASCWQIDAKFEIERSFAPQRRHLSGIGWSIAPTSDPDDIRDQFLRATRGGRYLHGTAGYGIVLPIDVGAMQRCGVQSTALASRFAGFEMLDALWVSQDATDGIKCVNWLTAVDDELLDRIGGRDAVRGRFSAAIVCHDLPHGLVVQAGKNPVLGDVNRVDELSHYREVAAQLRPIYAKVTGVRGLNDYDCDRDYTSAWRNRFFEGARWP